MAPKITPIKEDAEYTQATVTALVLATDATVEGLESCLNSLIFQKSQVFNTTVLVTPRGKQLMATVERYQHLFPEASLRMEFTTTNDDHRIIERQLEEVANPYVLLLSDQDRVNESLSELFSEKVKDCSWDLVYFPFEVIYQDKKTIASVPGKTGSQKPSKLIASTASEPYWGKIWNTEKLLNWSTMHYVSMDDLSLAPALISHCDKILRVKNKKEPQFTHHEDHCFQPVTPHPDVIMARQDADMRLIRQGHAEYRRELALRVIRRALDYCACSSVPEECYKHIKNVYETYLSDTLFAGRPDLNKRELAEVQRVIGLLPAQPCPYIYCSAATDELSDQLAQELKEFGLFGKKWTLQSINNMTWEDGITPEVFGSLKDYQCFRGLQKLYETGGIYINAELIPLDYFNRILFRQAFFLHKLDGSISRGIFGAVAGHPIVGELLEYCRTMAEQGSVSMHECMKTVLVGRFGMSLADVDQVLPHDTKVFKSREFIYPSLTEKPPTITRGAIADGNITMPLDHFEAMHAERRELQETVLRLEGKIESLESSLASSAEEISNLRSSISWQITHVFRALSRKLKEMLK